MPSLVNLAPTFIIYHGHLYFIHCEKNYVTLVITAWSHRLLIDQENTDSRASDPTTNCYPLAGMNYCLPDSKKRNSNVHCGSSKIIRRLWTQATVQESRSTCFRTRIQGTRLTIDRTGIYVGICNTYSASFNDRCINFLHILCPKVPCKRQTRKKCGVESLFPLCKFMKWFVW